MNQKDFDDFMFEKALQNALGYNGKANSKALIGVAVGKFKDIKKDINFYRGLIEQICDQVNAWSLDEQREKLLEINPNFLEKREKKEVEVKDKIPSLDNVDKSFKVRTEPSPSGHLHIGHIFNIIYNDEYRRKYEGKFLLRIADTNPQKILKEAYKSIEEDVKWLIGGYDELVCQSSRLDVYYGYLKDLIEKGCAYVCDCKPEVFKELIDNKKSCACRRNSIKVQRGKLNQFFITYKPGDAVVRFKADIEHKNPALRDFPLARISTVKHPKNIKKRVWPLMNFSVAIDDSVLGVTHVINGKDQEINSYRQTMILEALGLRVPFYKQIGMTNFNDLSLSKSKIRERVESGEFVGYDDPRLPTLKSFRRRGFKPEALRNFAVAQGVTKRDSKISYSDFMKSLVFFNKQVVDPVAHRYFFVREPVRVVVRNFKDIDFDKIKIPRHPDHKEYGFRSWRFKKEFFVDEDDFLSFKVDDCVRLMHFANFKVLSVDFESKEVLVDFVSEEFDKSLRARVIHFLPELNYDVVVVNENNEEIVGFGGDFSGLKQDDVIQFERFGFCRFDRIKDKKYIFYFTHR